MRRCRATRTSSDSGMSTSRQTIWRWSWTTQVRRAVLVCMLQFNKLRCGGGGSIGGGADLTRGCEPSAHCWSARSMPVSIVGFCNRC